MSENLVTPSGVQKLANGLHACLGALAILIPAFFWGPVSLLPAALAINVFAGVKEFWYDLKYETPATSGGLVGGLEDFAGYELGAVIAAGLVFLHFGTL